MLLEVDPAAVPMVSVGGGVSPFTGVGVIDGDSDAGSDGTGVALSLGVGVGVITGDSLGGALGGGVSFDGLDGIGDAQ